MSDRVRCRCRRCRVGGLMGPAIIITVGVLFLFDQVSGGNFSFGNTYPVILIVIGVISLAAAASSAKGHVSGAVPPPAPPAVPAAPENKGPGQGKEQKGSMPKPRRRRGSLYPGLQLLFDALLLRLQTERRMQAFSVTGH